MSSIAIIVGSLRKESLNRKMALSVAKLAPPVLEMSLVEIGSLPLYNEDLEADPPSQWTIFRDRVRAIDGVLFVTPEYNRGVPGGLKNAIDVGSRPYGRSVWDKKPVAVISVSPGAIGGYGANHALRQSFVFLDMPAMQQPEAYIGGAAKLFDADGGIANTATLQFLEGFVKAFASWVASHSTRQ